MEKYNKFAQEIYSLLKKYNPNIDRFDQIMMEYTDKGPYITGICYSDDENEFGIRPATELDYDYNREELIQLQNKFSTILKDIVNDKNIPNGFFYNDWGMFYIELKPAVKAQFFPEDSPVWGKNNIDGQ